MKTDRREQREEQIIKAAYDLLECKGASGLSMLAVAKAAKASNETLYRWYGDKQGLFLALVRYNLKEAEAILDGVPPEGDTTEVLAAFGPALLRMLVGPRAVALNRAAAADQTGTLGAALAKGGREVIRPRLVALLSDLEAPEQMADLYLTLLVGDLQIRRVTGALPELSREAIQNRSAAVLDIFTILTRPTHHGPAVSRTGVRTGVKRGPRGSPFWLGWVRS